MTDRPKTPIHLWIVGVVSLLWNAGGAYNYLMTKLEHESVMSQLTPEQVDFYLTFPAWATALWAIAVWGGLLGSALLVLRRALAYPVFAVAFVSMVGSTISTAVRGGFDLMGAGSMAFSAVIFVIALALVFYARAMAAKGVLR